MRENRQDGPLQLPECEISTAAVENLALLAFPLEWATQAKRGGRAIVFRAAQLIQQVLHALRQRLVRRISVRAHPLYVWAVAAGLCGELGTQKAVQAAAGRHGGQNTWHALRTSTSTCHGIINDTGQSRGPASSRE